MKCKELFCQLTELRYRYGLTFYRKRIEKQITEASEQAEKMKMEVMIQDLLR